MDQDVHQELIQRLLYPSGDKGLDPLTEKIFYCNMVKDECIKKILNQLHERLCMKVLEYNRTKCYSQNFFMSMVFGL